LCCDVLVLPRNLYLWRCEHALTTIKPCIMVGVYMTGSTDDGTSNPLKPLQLTEIIRQDAAFEACSYLTIQHVSTMALTRRAFFQINSYCTGNYQLLYAVEMPTSTLALIRSPYRIVKKMSLTSSGKYFPISLNLDTTTSPLSDECENSCDDVCPNNTDALDRWDN
jgi:hypothetical protein